MRNNSKKAYSINLHSIALVIHRYAFKEISILVFIILLASVVRLWNIGTIPEGLANDEAGYIYSAYSIWKTGKDPSGAFLPLSIELDNSFSPVYIYATAPFVGILGLSPSSGRLPFALTGILSVLMLYYVTKQISNNSIVALSASFFLAISPWHINVSRAAFDSNFALVFFLSSLYFFHKSLKKNSILFLILTILSSGLAFYSYHATKFYFVALIPFLIMLYWKELSVKKRIILAIGFFSILTSFKLLTLQGDISRSSVILSPNDPTISKQVNLERAKSTAPFFIRQLFSNKATVYSFSVIEKYLAPFSSQFLFLYGEMGGLQSVYGSMINQGMFLIITAPFLLLGIYGIKKVTQKTLLLLIGLTFIAPLPSALSNDTSHIFRSFMLLIPLPIIMAYGLNTFLEIIQRYPQFLQKILLGFLAILLFISFAAYCEHYFYRYPVYGAEKWFRSSRDLAEYLNTNRNSYDSITVAGAGNMFLFQYGIFNNIPPQIINLAWQQSKNDYSLYNITFTEKCPDTIEPPISSSLKRLYILNQRCSKNTQILPFSTIVNKGEPLHIIWNMYTY